MRIVLTGGPSAGKTSVVEVLARAEWDRLVVVQEAASVLYRGGFPRSQEEIHLRCQQRAIYHVQKELEEVGVIEGLHRHLICDRGSLDSLAYWPGSEDNFFAAVGTSMKKEIARYDWVIHLDTAAAGSYRPSKIRIEANAQAQILNEKVKQAWRMHPRRIIVPNKPDFLDKIHLAKSVVDEILSGNSPEAIRFQLNLPAV